MCVQQARCVLLRYCQVICEDKAAGVAWSACNCFWVQQCADICDLVLCLQEARGHWGQAPRQRWQQGQQAVRQQCCSTGKEHMAWAASRHSSRTAGLACCCQ
jgi:hypothetical protein